MIFQQVYGPGSGLVSIQGAPGETVTYSGKDSGSITLDSNGDGSVVLRGGTYSFSGSISSGTGFSPTNIRVRPGSVVTMCPEGARILYWCGRYGMTDDDQPVVNTHVVTSGRQNRYQDHGSYLTHEVYYGSGHTDASQYAKLMFSAIDLSPYSKAKVSIKNTNQSAGYRVDHKSFGYSTTSALGALIESVSYKDFVAGGPVQIYECSLANANDSYYLGVDFGMTTSYGTTNWIYTEVNAVWVE